MAIVRKEAGLRTLPVLILSLMALVSGPAQGMAAQKALLPVDLVEYFRGNWAGKGKFANSKDLESDLSFFPDLANQCMVVRQREKPPNDFEFIAPWSMDSVSGDLVMLLASNHDSGARLFRSWGWREGKLVFQSVPELRAAWALERFTFERVSANRFYTTYEMSMDGGKSWQVGDHQSFTKMSSKGRVKN